MQAPGAESAGCPRLVIAAPQGRSGKTTVSLGIGAALASRGLRVQAFKKGPDYIDPSWLSAASGFPCRSLDAFFLPDPDALRRAFLKGASQADICLVEGNHGLYDSLEPDGSESTAAVARTLQAPVILVLNAARMSRSAAAMVYGYQTFEPETNIAAVILNNVAQGRHESKLRQAIETYCRIPVLGALPRDALLTIPDRHLGLVPHGERDELPAAIEACRRAAEEHVDLPAVLEIARQAPALDRDILSPALAQQVVARKTSGAQITSAVRSSSDAQRPRIGVVRDRAFTFYYPENLEALEEAGAELVFVDALQDPHLPAIEGLYIGGGFPEMFLAELSANVSLRSEIRERVEDGLPVYAECGGLMYLSRRIHWGDGSAEMAGALPIEVEMTDKPQGHGYVLAECVGENPFFSQGARLRGHEFHHSRLVSAAEQGPRLRAQTTPGAGVPGEKLPAALVLERGNGLGDHRDGLVYKNVLACYMHLHAGGAPEWAPSLVARAAGTGKRVLTEAVR